MGSTETKEYTIPQSAYENLANRRNQFAHESRQFSNAATQHSAPSNLTMQQQQIIDDYNRELLNFSSEEDELEVEEDSLSEENELEYHLPGKVKPYDLMKQANSFSEVLSEKFVSYNDAKETPTEEKVDNTKILNIPISGKNILKYKIKPPEKLNDLDDFIKNWNVWKEQLTSFLALVDQEKKNYNQWGNFFLHFMGPTGQEILNELFFSKEEDKKNYEILLQKYNAFYKFHTTQKLKRENAVAYIEKLKGKVAQNFKNVDITIKNKIAQEIKKHCKERFVALAKSMLPKFKFETTFKSLTLAEIGFLWNYCEKSNFGSNRNCIYCGNFHQEGKCPSLDNECSKCNKKGHVAKHCPGLMYITNCNFCGGNHKSKHCPSYGEICSRCGHCGHFSWKCPRVTLVKDCRYCGLSHFMFRNACPAKNNVCSVCGECGHYYNKCSKIQIIVDKFEID